MIYLVEKLEMGLVGSKGCKTVVNQLPIYCQ